MSWKRFLLCCVLSIPLALGLYLLADLAVAAKAEGQKGKPATRMEHAVCGGCHKDQYESFVAVNLESKAKQEKATLWTLATC